MASASKFAWLQLSSVALVAVPCCREYLFIINITIKRGLFTFVSWLSSRSQFVHSTLKSPGAFIIQISRNSADVARLLYRFHLLRFVPSASMFYVFFLFFLHKANLARVAPYSSCLFLLSSSFLLSLFLSFSFFDSHFLSHPFFLLKSSNLQLLYNMTENTLDHDNTIIIVLCFLLFFNYLILCMLLFFYSSVFFVLLVREYHKTLMFT